MGSKWGPIIRTFLASYFAFLNGQFTNWGIFGFYQPRQDEFSCLVKSTLSSEFNETTQSECSMMQTNCAQTDTDCLAQRENWEETRCAHFEYNISISTINNAQISSLATEMSLICDNEWIISAIWSMNAVGNGFGAFVGGWSSDRFGRRRTLMLVNFAVAVFSLAASYSPTWQVFAVFWTLIWTFSSATYVTGSVYVVELLGDDNREWAMLVSVVFAIGEAVISLQAFLFPDWRSLMRVQSFIVMVYMLPLKFLPESQQWLDSRNTDSLLDTTALEKSTDVKAVLKNKLTLRIVLTCVVLYMANSICYFGLSFNASSLPGNLYVNNILNCAAEGLGYAVMGWFMVKLNRKTLIFGTLIIAAGLCAICGVLFSIDNEDETGRWLSFCGKFFISACFG